MGNDSLIAHRTREQLRQFMGIFYPHFSKPALGFIGEMLYGIQAAKDIKLSAIGRCLEEKIPLKKTEERLSRNLKHPDMERVLSECVAKEASRHIHRDTLIVIDPTDIQKLYAKKMPLLEKVWDGSKSKVGENLGYNCCLAMACESRTRRIIPLHMRLWSCSADGFKSLNNEISQTVETIRAQAGNRGIYVMDRGADGMNIYNMFMDNRLRFIIRMVGDRNLIWRKRTILAEKLADKCHMSFIDTIKRETPKGEKSYEIQYGCMDVTLPDRPDIPLRMVVVKGFSQKPMMILTNLAETTSRKALEQVVYGYLTRWRVEDAIRWIKQSYRIEDIRLMNYTRLKNMMVFLLAAAYFASVWLGESLRMKILVHNITRISKRLFGVAEFHYYAIADGLARLFNRHGKGFEVLPNNASPPSKQLLLSLFFEST